MDRSHRAWDDNVGPLTIGAPTIRPAVRYAAGSMQLSAR